MKCGKMKSTLCVILIISAQAFSRGYIPGSKKSDQVLIYSTSLTECSFKTPIEENTGVFIYHDTIQNRIHYNKMISGKTCHIETLDSLDGQNLLNAIDSVDYGIIDFTSEYRISLEAKKKHKKKIFVGADGCKEKLFINNRNMNLQIHEWQLTRKIESASSDNEKIQTIFKVNRLIYSIIGRYEMASLRGVPCIQSKY